MVKNEHYEKRNDQFDEFYSAWNYAIRGNTVDHRALRIIVLFEPEIQMLIITAFELAN